MKTYALDGAWRLDGNGFPGEMVLSVDRDGVVGGRLYREDIVGRWDPRSRQITFDRIADGAPVQTYTGVLTEWRRVWRFEGTFVSIRDGNWGHTAERHPWRAITGPPVRPAGLRALQGEWRVRGSQWAGAPRPAFPPETGLNDEGTTLSVQGNQLRRGRSVVATLAIDGPGIDGVEQPYTRHLIRLTAPGRPPMLCAYRLRSEMWEIVFPHSIVNVGGHQAWLVPDQAPTPGARPER